MTTQQPELGEVFCQAIDSKTPQINNLRASLGLDHNTLVAMSNVENTQGLAAASKPALRLDAVDILLSIPAAPSGHSCSKDFDIQLVGLWSKVRCHVVKLDGLKRLDLLQVLHYN